MRIKRISRFWQRTNYLPSQVDGAGDLNCDTDFHRAERNCSPKKACVSLGLAEMGYGYNIHEHVSINLVEIPVSVHSDTDSKKLKNVLYCRKNRSQDCGFSGQLQSGMCDPFGRAKLKALVHPGGFFYCSQSSEEPFFCGHGQLTTAISVLVYVNGN